MQFQHFSANAKIMISKFFINLSLIVRLNTFYLEFFVPKHLKCTPLYKKYNRRLNLLNFKITI